VIANVGLRPSENWTNVPSQANESVDLKATDTSRNWPTAMSDHNEVVERISKQFEKKRFQVQTRENNLPAGAGRNDAIYRPDMIVWNSEGQIVSLVEVETSEGGKAVAGAAILADICMENEMAKGLQNTKPNLLLVFYQTSANLELAVKRLTALRPKTTHLRDIDALNEREALLKISELHTNC